MDFINYVKKIKFDFVKPEEPAYKLEIKNTILPLENSIERIYNMPKMSTFAIGSLINHAVKELKPNQCYLNVGVWHGFTLFAGMFDNQDKTCIGVDNFSEFGSPRLDFRERFLALKGDNHSFFEMDFKRYFSDFHVGQIGLYFYDGSHDYQNQLEGLKVAEPFLVEDALIMVDDTNWPDPENATMDFIKQSKYNYEIILNEKTCQNMHPTWWNGIMIIKKGELK